MFLKKRKVNGTYYWSIVESYREEGKVKQKIIVNLGKSEKALTTLINDEKRCTHYQSLGWISKIQSVLIKKAAQIEELENQLFNEDCLMGMNRIPDKSVDMVLCDLPYGTTRNKWDSVLDLSQLWKQYNRIIKDNGAICLTAQAPFDKILANSNLKMLRYEWIWEKPSAT